MMTSKEILQCTVMTWLLLITCPPQVVLGKVRSHNRAVMMVVDDSNDESAIAVVSDAL